MKLENTMSAAEESAVQNLLSEIAINYCSWSITLGIVKLRLNLISKIWIK